jgi:hypothetical protein
MLPSVIGWIGSLMRVSARRVSYDAGRRSATGLNHRVGGRWWRSGQRHLAVRVARGGKKALVGDNHPTTTLRSGAGRCRLPGLAIPVADRAVITPRHDPAAISGGEQMALFYPACVETDP